MTVATATDLTLFREYEPHECGRDGYPFVWSKGIDPRDVLGSAGYSLREFTTVGVKDIVRAQAGHRCARCQHPYVVGVSGKWETTRRDTCVPAAGLLEQLEDGRSDPNQQEKYRRDQAILWSPCDGRCEHGGPMRVMCRQLDGGEAWEDFDPTPEACGPAVAAVAPAAVEAAWRILTVHHLNGRKHDLRWWNLAALCQRCHLVIQGKVQMERVYPLEHSAWFRPHAAGWYAYAYGGENLTREQTMDRLDELLALEQMA